MSADSESWFYLIDQDGNRRVPCRMKSRDGRQGYAVHPKGKGNDSSAADYTEDAKRMVQAVVLHGRGVRARTRGGPQDGQINTVILGGRAIRGYWLAPEHREWVAGASVSPESRGVPAGQTTSRTAPKPLPGKEAKSTPRADKGPVVSQQVSEFRTRESVRFSDHCCQGGEHGLAAGSFSLDDLTLASEGSRRLRFAPLGNRPTAPRLALVGITPGGQISRFASLLATENVESAARKAAFHGAQTEIRQLLAAHGFAEHIGLSLDGDLNENPEILTTSVVKCCLMVDDGYRFAAPDIAASPAATRCATERLVGELCSYPSLRWVVVFGKPAWEALHELRIDGERVIDVLRGHELVVIQFPHFAQNFQQRALYVCDEAAQSVLLAEKPDYQKYADAAGAMRAALLQVLVPA